MHDPEGLVGVVTHRRNCDLDVREHWIVFVLCCVILLLLVWRNDERVEKWELFQDCLNASARGIVLS